MARVLVVYYSRKGENHMPGGVQVLEKGNTAYAAEFIRDALDGDLFEIDTVKAYPENYRECCMQAVQEFKSGARPGIRESADVRDYDTVFVCYPCWCGTDLAAACPGAAVAPGLAVLGHTAPASRETITQWAREMAK